MKSATKSTEDYSKITDKTRWTAENLISAGRLYHKKYGETPGQVHFYPLAAKKSKRLDKDVLAERFVNDGIWPSSSTIIKHFKSFGAFQRACGFEATRTSSDASVKLDGLIKLQEEMGL